MAEDWRIFRGDNAHRGDVPLPQPPPWRRFPRTQEARGPTFQASEREIQMVNAALYLRRPLLVTGPPGSGKSSLIYAVAEELGLGEVLKWPINSRSTLADGLYRYDAVARLRDVSLAKAFNAASAAEPDQHDLGQYLTLGPLGTALLPTDRPRALLIDEIDKSDIDLPNDLLHVFEEGRFDIPELVRAAARYPRVEVMPAGARAGSQRVVIECGRVEATTFPFVVITSNGERELPPAFLRRCLRLEAPRADSDRLRRIVAAHLGDADGQHVTELIHRFMEETERGRMLAIDQLLNAVFLVCAERNVAESDWETVRDAILRTLDEE